MIGTSSVVTADVPDNAIVAGVPARLIRMRKAREDLPLGKGPTAPSLSPGAADGEEVERPVERMIGRVGADGCAMGRSAKSLDAIAGVNRS